MLGGTTSLVHSKPLLLNFNPIVCYSTPRKLGVFLMARQPKRRAQVEIEYEYHPTKAHSRVHWMYYVATGNTMEEMREDATKYFKSQIRSLGWGKITTLTEVRPMRSGGEPMKVKQVKEDKPKTKGRKPRRRTR